LTTRIGVIGTIAWLLMIVAVLWRRAVELDDTKLTAWASFVQGATAPIAFFWLVLGYFQQRQEIGQNTGALLLQQKELALQAQQTTNLAQNAERQARAAEQMTVWAEADRTRRETMEREDARVRLVGVGGSTPEGRVLANFANHGALVHDLRVEAEGDLKVEISPMDRLQQNQELRVTLIAPGNPPQFFWLVYRTRFSAERLRFRWDGNLPLAQEG
jgi:hypothetical protein